MGGRGKVLVSRPVWKEAVAATWCRILEEGWFGAMMEVAAQSKMSEPERGEDVI